MAVEWDMMMKTLKFVARASTTTLSCLLMTTGIARAAEWHIGKWKKWEGWITNGVHDAFFCGLMCVHVDGRLEIYQCTGMLHCMQGIVINFYPSSTV